MNGKKFLIMNAFVLNVGKETLITNLIIEVIGGMFVRNVRAGKLVVSHVMLEW